MRAFRLPRPSRRVPLAVAALVLAMPALLPSPFYFRIAALTFIFAILVVLFNLIADLLYGILDPRIRYT